MFFTLNSTKYTDLAKIKSYWSSKRTVIYYPMGVNELKLDKYLKESFNKSLKEVCLVIIKTAKYSVNNQNEIVITFPIKELDDLATLITYGNGVLQGSDILKYAFGRK